MARTPCYDRLYRACCSGCSRPSSAATSATRWPRTSAISGATPRRQAARGRAALGCAPSLDVLRRARRASISTCCGGRVVRVPGAAPASGGVGHGRAEPGDRHRTELGGLQRRQRRPVAQPAVRRQRPPRLDRHGDRHRSPQTRAAVRGRTSARSARAGADARWRSPPAPCSP